MRPWGWRPHLQCGFAVWVILWGAVAFLLNYVPILGPMIGIVMFTLAGLLTAKTLWPDGTSAAMADIARPEQEREYPEPSFLGPLPAQRLFVRHAKNVAFRHVEITSIQTDARPFVWRAMSTARTFPVSVCRLVTVKRRCVCTRSAICEYQEAEGSLIRSSITSQTPNFLRDCVAASSW